MGMNHPKFQEKSLFRKAGPAKPASGRPKPVLPGSNPKMDFVKPPFALFKKDGTLFVGSLLRENGGFPPGEARSRSVKYFRETLPSSKGPVTKSGAPLSNPAFHS